MSDRAAIVTGASRGIGFALAKALAEEGYQLTMTARKPAGLAEAAEILRGDGHVVSSVAVDIAEEGAARTIVEHHRNAYGRLDVLVNSAGLGVGATVAEHQVKSIDLQLQVNFRAIVLLYREAVELLRTAGAEHRSALVVNLASLAGKSGPAWLSVYGATKAAVVSYTESMNKELSGDGVRSVALCPGFVDTDMAQFVKDRVGAENMISPDDLVLALKFLLHLSPGCRVPEIVFQNAGSSPFGM